jgi:small subunit ribosomal protein S11
MSEEKDPVTPAEETPVATPEETKAPAEAAKEAKPAKAKSAKAAKKDDKADKSGEKKDSAVVEGDNPTAASLLDSGVAPIKRVKIKGAKNVPVGIVHVTSTFNNTMVSITDPRGNVIGWSTAGRSGFKGSRKSTAFAATMAAQDAARQAINHGLQEVEVRVQGPGAGRESAIRAVQASGINVTAIRDVTPMPHNGCRARKRRRV